MIQVEILDFLEKANGMLDGYRFPVEDGRIILPEVSQLVNNNDAVLDFIMTGYLTIVEAYAKQILAKPKYALKDEIEDFLKTALEPDGDQVMEFLLSINRHDNPLLREYYGMFPNTHWSFGDLAGTILVRAREAYASSSEVK